MLWSTSAQACGDKDVPTQDVFDSRERPSAVSISSLLRVPRLLRPVVRQLGRGATLLPRALNAVLILPRLADQLEQVVANTDRLSVISSELHRVALNTDNLTAVADHTGRLVDNTLLLPRTHSELLVMQAAIVEMQGSTSAMATDVSKLVRLESAVPPLLPLLREVDGHVGRLTEILEPLSGATSRVGRFADRLPSRARLA
jgi:hypothetical protein